MAAITAAEFATAAKNMEEYVDTDVSEMVKYLERVEADEKLDSTDSTRLIMILIKSVQSLRRNKSHDKQIKRISESRGIASLKTYSGDKQDFQEWIDKLINQFNVTHSGARLYLKEVIKVTNVMKKTLATSEIDGVRSSLSADEKRIVHEDMHFILTDKTSGEPKSRVGMFEVEEGITAFSSLIMWYSTASGEAIQERTRRIMNPGTPKKDEDIHQILEKWVKEVQALEGMGVASLPSEFKMTSLKIIMLSHADRFDSILKTVSRPGLPGDERVKEMIDLIRDFAAELRMRNLKPSASPFVDEIGNHEGTMPHECEYYDAWDGADEWHSNQESWHWDDEHQVFAMAKGKAKGKGKPYFTSWKGKGKGKGKGQGGKGKGPSWNTWTPAAPWQQQPYSPGQEGRTCFKCGEAGHIAANCPQYPPGTKGVMGFKGQGGKGKRRWKRKRKSSRKR